MPELFLSVILSSLAFGQMVTLQLLNEQEQEKEESSSEEEQELPPPGLCQEQLGLPSSAPSPAPPHRERPESPRGPSEQVQQEADSLLPQDSPTAQNDGQEWKGEISEVKDGSPAPEQSCVPSHRVPGPPTSIPPQPPSHVIMDCESEGTPAASPVAAKPESSLGKVHTGEVTSDGPLSDSPTRLPLTTDPKMADPLTSGSESAEGRPQPPGSSEGEDVSICTGSSEEPTSTEAGSAGAALGPSPCSRHSRYVPLSTTAPVPGQLQVEVVLVIPRAATLPFGVFS